MSWSFQAGMRVSCVSHEWEPVNPAPEIGRIYVITEVRAFPAGTLCRDETGRSFALRSDHIAIRIDGFGIAWWTASAFRPLDESRLDQFRAHLAPKGKAKKAVDA